MENDTVPVVAWRYFESEDGIAYCVQFDRVPKRWKTKLHRMLRGWKELSIGFGSEYNTIVFKKDFKNSQDWLKWIKKFPYQITFESNSGRARIYNKRKGPWLAKKPKTTN